MDLEHIKKEFGLRVKLYRKHNKKTQEDFAELIELEQPSLSNIENGKTYPTFLTVCNLIEKAGIEPSYLFEFLSNNTKHHKFVDDEILDLLKHIPPKAKEHIKEILKSIVKTA